MGQAGLGQRLMFEAEKQRPSEHLETGKNNGSPRIFYLKGACDTSAWLCLEEMGVVYMEIGLVANSQAGPSWAHHWGRTLCFKGKGTLAGGEDGAGVPAAQEERRGPGGRPGGRNF